ncbi:cell division protein FtsK [Bacillus sp. AFS001701]|uniref:DNA translocase FtsK n=1 Tax=Bacillus sp. AFS001701 TaxID=2033480 RepID=UPI000BF883CA|nr:DNA translocase FtsK [Bacillus sp. AFS001701]PET76158.1 cell division protein FtsK [Bacillus sp. AFS001701]
MKKWLKSLFKANSLNEIEEEFEEKPVEENVYQSHSIEKKRNALSERPKFRFPIDLDEELPTPEPEPKPKPELKPIKETKIEPVLKQEKNNDIWNKSPNNLNKEYKPTYNQSNNFVRNTFQTNQFGKSNLSSRLEKNQVSKSEEEPAKVEKEEKVDIVFRPKRKTPFRPSEYISPIYGYQKPPVKDEEVTDYDTSSTNEEINSEVSQINNVIESSFRNDEIDTFNSKDNRRVGNQDQEIIEVVNLPEKEEIQTESNQVESEEIQTEVKEEVPSEAYEIEAEVRNEEVQFETLGIEAEFEVKEEEVQSEAHEIEAEVEGKEEEVQSEAHEIEAEVKNEEVQFETLAIEANVEVKEEEVQSETHEIEAEVKNEEVQFETLGIEAEVEGKEEEVQSEAHEIEAEVKNEEVQPEIHQNVEKVELKVIDESEADIKESKEESVHHESSTVESNVEETVEINLDLVTSSNEQLKPEIEANGKESEQKPVEKRQKKRHFPFNVLMLKSDVDASRKANIMRQLRELQKESAATVEKVNEEVESKQVDQKIGNGTLSEQSEQKIENVSLSEQNEQIIGNVSLSEQNDQKIENVSLSEQSEMVSLENKVQPSEEAIEVFTHEKTHEEINHQTVLETESETDTNLTEVTVQNNEHQSTGNEVLNMPPVLYELPELDLLVEPPIEQFNDGDWVEGQKHLLQETLHNFNVGAKVIAATQGPTVTRFEVQPDPGVKVNKITNLQDDIKLSLAARDIRIEAPIPGRSAIGIEVPNKESKPVYLRELVSQDKFLQSESPLTVALGLDIGGDPVYADISKMPHGLIAGATGSGKSVCINSILVSILYKAKPHEVKLILIDPKMVELAPYNHIPHLISPVITDARAATAALKWACDEMDRRYDLFAHAGARDIKRFNDLAKKKGAYNDELPYLVIIIDELADLMMVSPGDVETYICRIAQKARACGIHLLVATQRPSVDVITGIIKSNIPTRIAFTVSSQVDSRTIIDIGGAEKLLGRGDMLFLDNGKSQAIRLQGVYVSDDEIEHVVEIVKDQQKPNYLFNQEELVAKADAQDVDDELFEEAVEFVIDQKGASVSMLQRRFRIGYNRAARLIDLMFDHGIVSNQNGSKPRVVLITSLEEFRSE